MVPKTELSYCPLCSSGKIFSLNGYENHYLARCASCRLVFCKRIPTQDELLNYYNLYPRRNFISPITIKRYHHLLEKMERFRRTNKIIDVGCGDGYFLEIAKSRGWEVYGTELTPEAIRICEEKSIKMFRSPLQPDDFHEDLFDVITSFEVFEHINTPVSELASFRKILRPGGLVYLTTPNFDSLSRYLLGSRWNAIAYPEHLTYYNRGTLIDFFSDNGFKVLESSTTGISLDRIKQSTYPASVQSSGNYDELLRKNLESNLLLNRLKAVVNFALNLFDRGDSLKVYFIRQ